MEEIRCEAVRKLLSDYQKSLLNPPEKGQVERHLFYCSDCFDQMAMQKANEKKTTAFLLLSQK
jgi:anti-sigma factor RsiW